MLGRVANAIYWMNRFVERADNVARFIEVNHHLVLDLPVGAKEQWGPLVIASGDEEPFQERYGKASRQNVIEFLTFDPDNPNSIRACMRSARENARSVREIISTDIWRTMNELYLSVENAANDQTIRDAPHPFFTHIRRSSSLFGGITDTTMSHGEAWQFSLLGRMLERADKTTRILDVKYFFLLPKVSDVGTPFDSLHWASLLRSTSAFEMYRQAFGRIRPNQVVEFLLLNRYFPRAVLYCLTRANESLHAITGTPLGEFANDAERHMGALRSEVAYVEAEDIIRGGLHEYIDSFQTNLNQVGQAIYEQFFALRSIDRHHASVAGILIED